MSLIGRVFLALWLTSAAIAAARAQPVQGMYVGAGAGFNLLPGNAVSVLALSGRSIGPPDGVSPQVSGKLGWSAGEIASAAVGYGVGNGVRLELEGSFRDVQQDHDSSGGVGGGRQTQYGVMANLLYDIDTGEDWLWPYVGLGGGYQWADWRRVGLKVDGIDYGNAGTTVTASQTLGGLAWQGIAGVAFPLADVPGLAVTAEYRYMNFAGSRNYHATGVTPGVSGLQPNNTTRIHAGDNSNHSVLLGLRYAFDAMDGEVPERPPLAAPVDLPVPAQVRTYLVFFDWNSADLTPRAREIIDEAVRNAGHVTHTRIEVTGHSDTSGTPLYNQLLSVRRAQTVAAELAYRGVPPESIDMHGYGDTRPLVPTGPGVREPQNRRVEIVYR